jgi:TPP-dependent pyruvate/acetoin dehydrogenase alpha subunit
MSPSYSDPKDLYLVMYRIRRFEETVLENFPKGNFTGTTHTYLGQEANAVAVLSQIQDDDIVFSNHRGHGHFLAYGGNMRSLFAELMGKSTGVCGGRGGSQHLQWKNFYSNGVQGGIVPVATGMALAERFKRSDAITIAFLGDGTLGEGVIYEAFNMAALWKAPILYVLENNHIAQTTPIHLAVSGEISTRFEAFGIPTQQLDSSDVAELVPLAAENLEAVRCQKKPHALIIHTHRFGPHSKGDDTRTREELSRMRKERDPLAIQGMRLPTDDRKIIEDLVETEIKDAYEQALSDPFPDPQSIVKDS